MQTANELMDVFGERLKEIGKMVCVLDVVKDSIFTKRIYCIYETFQCEQNGIPMEVIRPSGSPDFERLKVSTLAEAADYCRQSVCSEHAKATEEEDRLAIKRKIEATSSFDRVDRLVSEALGRSIMKEVLHERPQSML